MNTSERVELKNGTVWWVTPSGILHRTDGPALITLNGTKFWYMNGTTHRVDGPAVIYTNGDVEYWLEDTEYDPITFLIKSYEYQK